LKGSWPWPWTGSYCIPWCIKRTLPGLPTYQFHWNRRYFLWTDGCTDRHMRPTLLGRLRRRQSRPNKKSAGLATD